MKKQQGFTLIELMIVVAIIAILAAIALPAYQDYIKRSKVSEAVVAASACKTSVAEFVASENALPADFDESGCVNQTTQYVSDLDWTGTAIEVTMQNVGTGVDGQKLILTPDATDVADGAIPSWACSSDVSNKALVPASCRGAGGSGGGAGAGGGTPP